MAAVQPKLKVPLNDARTKFADLLEQGRQIQSKLDKLAQNRQSTLLSSYESHLPLHKDGERWHKLVRASINYCFHDGAPLLVEFGGYPVLNVERFHKDLAEWRNKMADYANVLVSVMERLPLFVPLSSGSDSKPKGKPRLIVPQSEAHEVIANLLKQGQSLRRADYGTEADFRDAVLAAERWLTLVATRLERLFESADCLLGEFRGMPWFDPAWEFTDHVDDFHRALAQELSTLTSIGERLLHFPTSELLSIPQMTNLEPTLKVPFHKVQGDLVKLLHTGYSLRDKQIDNPKMLSEANTQAKELLDFTKKTIGILIDNSGGLVHDFDFYFDYNAHSSWESELQSWQRRMNHYIMTLEPILQRLKNYTPTTTTIEKAGMPTMASKDVFIVHGHDDLAKEQVARFVEKLGLNAIILHEKASQNKTIIEKIEAHSDAAFAIAILTPDDFGGTNTKPTDSKFRARQNVIFEFGYFIGKLRRENVCALVKGDVEHPSDINGVVYIKMDGDWQRDVARELKAAKIPADFTKLI